MATPGDNPPQGRRPEGREPLARSIGAFFGEVWRGFTTPVDRPKQAQQQPETTELDRTTETIETTTPDGRRITLRRTTIDEIEVHPDDETPDDVARDEPRKHEP